MSPSQASSSQSAAGGPQTVSLGDEEQVKRILVDSILGLWDVVNNLTRLRPSRRDRYRVTIFGSARATPGTFAYNEVQRLAAALTEMGCDIVTGGGPGLMQAANEGAHATGVRDGDCSLGIRVELPFEQDVNPFVQQAYEHKSFFTRLHHFVLASDAYVVAPGGIGTVLELMMIWQLLQVRHVHGTPLILVGEMWQDLVDWAARHLLKTEPPLASPADIAIPRCVASADEAIKVLREHFLRWEQERNVPGDVRESIR